MNASPQGNIEHEVFAAIILALLLAAVSSLCTANIYFTESSVLKDLENNCPGIKKIVKSERNFFAKSLITVETAYGDEVVYELDTNIRFNYSYNSKTR